MLTMSWSFNQITKKHKNLFYIHCIGIDIFKNISLNLECACYFVLIVLVDLQLFVTKDMYVLCIF